MSDNKNEPRKAELVKSSAGKVTRIESPPQTGIRSLVSQIFSSPQRDKKRIEAATQVVKAQTELGEAHIERDRTTDRLIDLETILATDQEKRNSAYLQALKTRVQLKNEIEDIAEEQRKKATENQLREKLLRAKQELEVEEQLAEITARRKRLQESEKREEKESKPRSAVDELRAAVSKDTEMENARAQVLAEERSKCEEMVRRGEMTREDMDHHLSIVKARLIHHAARKQ